jgi:GT2 family glycosyltransferase
MITIIYSTHKDKTYNQNFKTHLSNTIGVKDYEILEYENHNQYSLSHVYNEGISKSKFEIIVCIHNDIKLEKGWGKKLLKDFEDNPEYGIIGKAGSCNMPISGVYWENMNQTMVGQVYHEPTGKKKWLSSYSPKLPFLIPVVTIDGLFISLNKNKVKHLFDETIGKFHFYDHLFCIPNFLDGVKIGVTSSFEITHQSVGQPNNEFWESREKFIDKWCKVLPIDLKPEKIHIPEIKEKPLKNIGKVAVIILTKGKIDLLTNCINSFYRECNSELFDIFIADTGSTDIEKKEIIKNILPLGNIKLIEYDFYNFAKINNDVAKNYIGDKYDYLLFSNNDIELLNNVIYGMLKIFKTTPKVGTVGCRLHFEDNTIQHGGIFMGFNQQNQLMIGHNGLKSYYNVDINQKPIIGSTGALMMIKKNVFNQCGGFNENYTTCFEDVELNLKCQILNYNNIYDGGLVAYHLESQTRGKDNQNQVNENYDYSKTLIPFINKNLDKLKNKLINN